jgi:hypothetical protein
LPDKPPAVDLRLLAARRGHLKNKSPSGFREKRYFTRAHGPGALIAYRTMIITAITGLNEMCGS